MTSEGVEKKVDYVKRTYTLPRELEHKFSTLATLERRKKSTIITDIVRKFVEENEDLLPKNLR